MFVVYKLYCKTEKKSYIGITHFESGKEHADDAIVDRFKQHAGENTPVGKAIAKYGGNDFTYTDLATCYTEQKARDLEHEYIRQYNTLIPRGYNQRP